MSLLENGSAAVELSTPRSAVRASLLRCAGRLEYVGQLAGVAAESGRLTHGARYVLDVVAELERDLALLRRHVRAAPPESL